MTKEELFKELNGHEQNYFNFFEKMVAELKPKTILEVGSGWGISAVAFLYKSDAHLTTIDKVKDLPLFDARIKMFGIEDRIKQIRKPSFDALREIKEQFDIVYIDGGHRYEDVVSDLDKAWGLVKAGGVMFLDDVYHYLNWRVELKKETKEWDAEYGVTKALLEKIKAAEKKITIYPVANGITRIDF